MSRLGIGGEVRAHSGSNAGEGAVLTVRSPIDGSVLAEFPSVSPEQVNGWVDAGEALKQLSPLESLKHGVALCPEDRKAEGIVGELTIRENIILALQARYGWFKFISARKQYEIAQEYIDLLGIRTPSPDQLVKNLSGGNQQKVILARWLVTQPHILILDEPTRGIDVGAKAEIQKLVLELASTGMSVMFISSELEEVLRISHRIVVLRDRKKAAEYSSDVSDQTIMHTMAGDL